jgi:hypothetical protein
MKLMERAPLLKPHRTIGTVSMKVLGHRVKQSRGLVPPSSTIPVTRLTPRPREPKPTPGTVAFPLAPLQCRCSLYTIIWRRKPAPDRIKVKPNPGVCRCEGESSGSVRDRRTVRWESRQEKLRGKSDTTGPILRPGCPAALPAKNLRLVSENYGVLFREVNHTSRRVPFCKLRPA